MSQTITAIGVSAEELADRVDQLLTVDRQRYRRLWGYYRNSMRPCGATGEGGADRPYRQAQEWGLPSRITGVRYGAEILAGQPVEGVARKEVVIENDIGWRIDTMVDFLFGKPLVITSTAADPERRDQISELLRLIIARSGGVLLLQQLALLGSVYGFVDVLVKYQPCDDDDDDAPGTTCTTQDLGHPPACDGPGDDPTPAGSAPRDGDDESRRGEAAAPGLDDSRTPAASTPSHGARALSRLARMVRLEIVEPARALPFLSSDDYRVVDAYAQCYEAKRTSASRRAMRDQSRGASHRSTVRTVR